MSEDKIRVSCWLVNFNKDVMVILPASATVQELKQKLIDEFSIDISEIYVIKNIFCNGEAIKAIGNNKLSYYIEASSKCTNTIYIEAE